MGPQAMEGNLIVAPGAALEAGYDFTVPGSHPAVDVTFVSPAVTFEARCVGGGVAGAIVVQMPTATYADPTGDSNWFPSGDQQSQLVYEGSVSVPDLCGGASMSLSQGGTFTTTVQADAQVPGDGVHVRWHYSSGGSSGSWSGTAHLEPGAPSGGGGGSNF